MYGMSGRRSCASAKAMKEFEHIFYTEANVTYVMSREWPETRIRIGDDGEGLILTTTPQHYDQARPHQHHDSHSHELKAVSFSTAGRRDTPFGVLSANPIYCLTISGTGKGHSRLDPCWRTMLSRRQSAASWLQKLTTPACPISKHRRVLNFNWSPS